MLAQPSKSAHPAVRRYVPVSGLCVDGLHEMEVAGTPTVVQIGLVADFHVIPFSNKLLCFIPAAHI
jgi:hypothetical protein